MQEPRPRAFRVVRANDVNEWTSFASDRSASVEDSARVCGSETLGDFDQGRSARDSDGQSCGGVGRRAASVEGAELKR